MNLLALLTLLAGAVADTAVVCPGEYRPALAPWVALREAEGHEIAFLPASADVAAVRESIRRAAAGRSLRYVLLVGDAQGPAGSARRGEAGGPRVPTRHVAAQVNVRFGSEPEIATDNWLADLDDDGAPDLAIGRLTADSPEELAVMVAKILAYEANRDFGPWRREIHFVAGVGGFGPLIDSAVEVAVKSVIASELPPSYHAVMTQANWTSPYFPDPRAFRRAAQAGMRDGCLFWVYLGHGRRTSLDDSPLYANRSEPILDSIDARGMTAGKRPAIACLFACHCGAYDGGEDCLGEELLKARGGPVAVLCASRVTMPYGMTVLGTELLSQSLVERRRTLGDAVLAAKRAAADPAADSSLRRSLDTMARLLSPAPVDLPGERAEHVAMFNLLGDPLLSLKHPQPIALRAPTRAVAGGEV